MSTPNSTNSRKRRAETDQQGVPAKRAPDPNTVQFRLLCPAQKIGSIIGKGGEIVSRIRQETGARVKVENSVPDCPERVILLTSAVWENEQQLVPAQSAILAIIERLYFDDKPQDEARRLVVRLLIDRSQTGPVLGRGGSIITKMRQESGASIKILHGQELPSCADPQTDDLLEITGEYDDCRQAVLLVSHRLRESPVKGAGAPARIPPVSEVYDHGLSHQQHLDLGAPHMGYGIDNPSLSTDGFTGDIETIFRLLCPEGSIGCVIGRGGEVVKRIRAETGARLKVMDAVEGAVERVVHCSSTEDVHSPVVAAIDALLRCIHCLLSDMKGPEPIRYLIRMLVPANQIGAVLGKGGSTIKQIRSDTGAHLVVLPREKTPACGERGDEVLTVEGSPPAIMDAMSMVASLLRNNMIRTQGVQMMGAGTGSLPPPPMAAAYPQQQYPTALPPGGITTSAVPLTLLSTQPGVQGVQLPHGMVDLQALAQQGYQVVSMHGGQPTTVQVVTPHQMQPLQAPAPVATAPAPQQHYTYVQTPQTWQPGADPAYTATSQVGAPLGNQPHHQIVATAPPAAMPPPVLQAPPPAQPATNIVPLTFMVKLLIQASQVGPLLGSRGSNINHIRQASGARVKLYDSASPTGERELELTGSYEQTQEAQRLVSEILTAAAAQGIVG